MLAFVSDLHLGDRTAGVHFLPASAFELALREIAAQAKAAGSQEVELVFLGDIVDLIRTTRWGELPEAERPWGVPPDLGAVERHCLELLDQIALRNRATFEILGGSLRERFPDFQAVPEELVLRLYPGSHHRPCNQFPSLRSRVAGLLGITDYPAQPFAHQDANLPYAAFGRHGHEFDVYNIELALAIPPRADPHGTGT